MLRHFILSICIFILLVIFSLFLPLRFWLSFATRPTALHCVQLSGNLFSGHTDLVVSEHADHALTDTPDRGVTLIHRLHWHWQGFAQGGLTWTLSGQELTSPAPIVLTLKPRQIDITALRWHLPLHALMSLNHWFTALRLSGDSVWYFQNTHIDHTGISTLLAAQLFDVGSRLIPLMSLGSYSLHLGLIASHGTWTLNTQNAILPISGHGALNLNPFMIRFDGQVDISRHPELLRPLVALAGAKDVNHSGPIPLHFVFDSVSQ